MAKCCVVFSQSPFEDLTAFRVRHVLLLVSILTSNAPGQCVICIQETWLQDDSKIPLVSLEGYKCFHVKASTSAHGGLITCVDDEFDVSVKRIITKSNIWEGQFLELNHGAFQNNIVIGNVYKPPRDDNNAGNLNAFKAELEPILQELSSTNNEVLICGDYNINLLKLNGETHFSDFLDIMLGHSFYPKITLPTRVNRSCVDGQCVLLIIISHSENVIGNHTR